MKTAYSEEELLIKRIQDGIILAEKRPQFIGFLSETDTSSAEAFLGRQKGVAHLLWGGYAEAERRVLGIFPDYLLPKAEVFPVAPITFAYRQEDVLTHRDFLGALMGLGIERAVVGDILPSQGSCVLFLRQEMLDYVINSVCKIGNTGVRVSAGYTGALPAQRNYQALSGVIASNRLDCITALLCKTSREKAVLAISAGLVLQNHREVLSPAAKIHPEDVISIRKKGKYIVDQLGPLTGKGRLSVKYRKYI